MRRSFFVQAMVGGALVLSCLAGPAAFAERCTAAQRDAADAKLLDLSRNEAKQQDLIARHAPFGLPVTTGDARSEQALYHGGYILGHDGDLRTTLWVSYRLTSADVAAARGQKRVECFRTDPRLNRDMAATPADYKEPVFDQGHMTNDADLKDDTIEQINTYVMSNMSPQHCRFNRGVWLSLEHLTRQWAQQYGDLLVTSGAIFDRDGRVGRDDDNSASRMQSNSGKARVAIPSHYYKVFLRPDGGRVKAIAFKLAHDNNDHGQKWRDVLPYVRTTIVSLAEVETAAGVDLFPMLDPAAVDESVQGDGWNLADGLDNFSGSCS